MNWQQIEGKWKETVGGVREQWGRITDNDLEIQAGKQDQFIGRLQWIYGYGKDKAMEDMNLWLTKFESSTD